MKTAIKQKLKNRVGSSDETQKMQNALVPSIALRAYTPLGQRNLRVFFSVGLNFILPSNNTVGFTHEDKSLIAFTPLLFSAFSCLFASSLATVSFPKLVKLVV